MRTSWTFCRVVEGVGSKFAAVAKKKGNQKGAIQSAKKSEPPGAQRGALVADSDTS